MTAISQQLTFGDWSRGWIAKPDPWELPPDALGYAQNANLRNGRIEPITGLGGPVSGASGRGPYRFLHRFDEVVVPDEGVQGGEYWFASAQAVFAVPVTRYVPEPDQWMDELIFLPAFQDDVAPGIAVVVDDGTPTPLVTLLGVPAPELPPALSMSAGPITAVDVNYVYTYVDVLGYESAPSPPTSTFDLNSEQVTVEVTPHPDYPQIKGYRLYRGVNGTYQLVTEWDAPTVTVIDDKPNDDLGKVLTTAGKSMPPLLHGLAFGNYNDEWAGFWGSQFFRSLAGQPDNWDPSGINIGARITAAIGTDYGWLVLTESAAHLITGSGAASTVIKDYAPYGCPYGASFTYAKTNVGWVWWSRQGLVAWSGAAFTLLTKAAFSDAQVALLQPDGTDVMALKGAFVDGEYRLFHGCGCLRVDLRDGVPVFTTACISADAVHVDQMGALYVADNDRNDVRPWKDGEPMILVVQTGEYVAPSQADRFHVHGARIRHSGGSLMAQWYQGETKHGPELPVPANGLLWCPRDAWDRTSLELWGTATIHAITVNPFSEGV